MKILFVLIVLGAIIILPVSALDSPILMSGIISTSEKDYEISNQIEIREFKISPFVRASGITVTGEAFYFFHIMTDEGNIITKGKVFDSGNTYSIIFKDVPVQESDISEEIPIVKEVPELPNLLILTQQDTISYWKENYELTVRIYDESLNKFNNISQISGYLEGVDVTVTMIDPEGNTFDIFSGKTDDKGFFEISKYLVENLTITGEYTIEITAGPNNNVTKTLSTIVGGRSPEVISD